MIERRQSAGHDLSPAPEAAGETDAARRALPMSRLVGNGMDHDDAALLHGRSAAGARWTDAAEAIGAAKLARATEAMAAGRTVSARGHLWHAAAAFRFGQSALIADGPRKAALYQRSADAFAQAARLATQAYRKVAIPFEGGALHGWLMLPDVIARPPAVIVFGGADGCREEYHRGALALLERGVAALLLDGPGQGETRVRDGLYLRPGIERAFSAAVGFLLADAGLGDRIGLWGNSLGGCFAARTASADPRVAACCVTGGTWLPTEILDRFPRFIERMRAMTGQANPDEARAILARHTLPRHENRISCPLLVVHGAEDRLFSVERATEVATWSASADRRVVVWDDGDHCVYNHTEEKHCLVADWFADALAAGK